MENMDIVNASRKAFAILSESWPWSLVSTVCCFLFGGSEAILAAVIVFVALDTITKWAAISKKYLLDHGHTEENITASAMICGFFYAWAPGYLTSTDLRRHWGEKIFTYSILIIFAGVMARMPEIVLFGMPVNKSISGGIYTCIAITELSSIAENLETMGYRKLADLKQFICTLTTRLTGGSYSVTVSNQQGPATLQKGVSTNASGNTGSHPDNG